jgi:hypothetical protein
MTGILVHGDNHFIVQGPMPDRLTALELVRHWSLIQIGSTTPPVLDRWQIVTREFRENLEWAVVIPGDSNVSSAVTQLLAELSARGIAPVLLTRPLDTASAAREDDQGIPS